MAILNSMRHDSAFVEDYFYIASDGYAYRRTRSGKVARYAHDGGTQVADYTRTVLTREEIGEELWKEIQHAFLSNRE